MARLRTLIQVPPDLVAEIDLLVGPRKRSAFLVELARRELKRQRLLKTFAVKQPIWHDSDHPDLAQDGSEEWVRRLRTESESRFLRLQEPHPSGVAD